MANFTFQFKGGTEDNWNAVNPILAEREVGVVLDNNNQVKYIKFGDGKNPFQNLPVFYTGLDLIESLSSNISANDNDIAILYNRTAALAYGNVIEDLQNAVTSIESTISELATDNGIFSIPTQLKLTSKPTDNTPSYQLIADGNNIIIGNTTTINKVEANLNNIVIGNNFSTSKEYNDSKNIAIGNSTVANGENSIVIGHNAESRSNNNIQIGYGTNYVNNSFKVANAEIATNINDKDEFMFNKTGVLNTINTLNENNELNGIELKTTVTKARFADNANIANTANEVVDKVYNKVNASIDEKINDVDYRANFDKSVVAAGNTSFTSKDIAKVSTVGYNTEIDNYTINSTAIGYGAKISPPFEYVSNIKNNYDPPYIHIDAYSSFNAIQLGEGKNTRKNSLQFFNQRLIEATDILDTDTYKIDRELIKRSINGVEISATITKAVSADFANYASNTDRFNNLSYTSVISDARKNIVTDSNKNITSLGTTVIPNNITNDIIIGNSTIANSNNTVVVGQNSSAENASNSIAIGNNATITATGSIQLGEGTNSTNNTFAVFNTAVIENLDTDPNIPGTLLKNSVKNLDIEPNSVVTNTISNVNNIAGTDGSYLTITNIESDNLTANTITISNHIVINEDGNITTANGLTLDIDNPIETPTDNSVMRYTDVKKYINDTKVRSAINADMASALAQPYEIYIGETATAKLSGIAIGANATANKGIAIGKNAIATNNVQLGEGENTSGDKTLKLYDETVVSAYNGTMFINPSLIIDGLTKTDISANYDDIELQLAVAKANTLEGKTVEEIRELISGDLPLHKTETKNGIVSNTTGITANINSSEINIANTNSKIDIDNNITVTTTDLNNLVIGTNVELSDTATNNVIIGKYEGKQIACNNSVVLGHTPENIAVANNALYFNGNVIAAINDDNELEFNLTAVNKVATPYPVSASFEKSYVYVGKNIDVAESDVIAIGNNVNANESDGIIVGNNIAIDNNSYAYGYVGFVQKYEITNDEYDFIKQDRLINVTVTDMSDSILIDDNSFTIDYNIITYTNPNSNNTKVSAINCTNITKANELITTNTLTIPDTIILNKTDQDGNAVKLNVEFIGYNNITNVASNINASTEITLPNTIKYISNNAFSDSNITNIDLQRTKLAYDKIIEQNIGDGITINAMFGATGTITFADGSTINNDSEDLSYNVVYDTSITNSENETSIPAILLLTSSYINLTEDTDEENETTIYGELVNNISDASSYINNIINDNIATEKQYFLIAKNYNNIVNTAIENNTLNVITVNDLNNIDINDLYVNSAITNTSNSTNLVIGNNAIIKGTNNIVINNIDNANIFDKNSLYINNTKVFDLSDNTVIIDKDVIVDSFNVINNEDNALTFEYFTVGNASRAEEANNATNAEHAKKADEAAKAENADNATNANNIKTGDNEYSSMPDIINNIPIELSVDENNKKSILIANKNEETSTTASNYNILTKINSSVTSDNSIVNTNNTNVNAVNTIINTNTIQANTSLTTLTKSIATINNSTNTANTIITDSIVLSNNVSHNDTTGSIVIETVGTDDNDSISIKTKNNEIALNDNIHIESDLAKLDVSGTDVKINDVNIVSYNTDSASINEDLLNSLIVLDKDNKLVRLGKNNTAQTAVNTESTEKYSLISIGNNISNISTDSDVGSNYVVLGNNVKLPVIGNTQFDNFVIIGSNDNNGDIIDNSILENKTLKDLMVFGQYIVLYSEEIDGKKQFVFNGSIAEAEYAENANLANIASNLSTDCIEYLHNNEFDIETYAINANTNILAIGKNTAATNVVNNNVVINNDLTTISINNINNSIRNSVIIGESAITENDSVDTLYKNITDKFIVMGQPIVDYSNKIAKLDPTLLNNSGVLINYNPNKNNVNIGDTVLNDDSESSIVISNDTNNTSTVTSNSIVVGNINGNINYENAINLGYNNSSNVATDGDITHVKNNIVIGNDNHDIGENTVVIGNNISDVSNNTVHLLDDKTDDPSLKIGTVELLQNGKINPTLISFTNTISTAGNPDVYYSRFDNILQGITKIQIKSGNNNVSGSYNIMLPANTINTITDNNTTFLQYSVVVSNTDNINNNNIPTAVISGKLQSGTEDKPVFNIKYKTFNNGYTNDYDIDIIFNIYIED